MHISILIISVESLINFNLVRLWTEAWYSFCYSVSNQLKKRLILQICKLTLELNEFHHWKFFNWDWADPTIGRIPRTLWQILKTNTFYKISHDFPAVEQMMKGFLIWTILLVSPLVSTVTAQWKFDQNELKIRETKFFSKKNLFQNSMLALVQSNWNFMWTILLLLNIFRFIQMRFNQTIPQWDKKCEYSVDDEHDFQRPQLFL